MMDKDTAPLVTCIMLTYRRFDLIYEAIDSVLSQDYPNIEFILGDDSSDGFPEDELRNYIYNHKGDNIRRVEIYSNEVNLGTVKNYNRALKMAEGKYLIGLANDDLFYNGHVMSSIVEEFERTGAQIITCRRVYIDRKTGQKLMIMPDKRTERFIMRASPSQMYNRQALLSIFIAGTYKTRTILKKYGNADERYRYMEDYSFYLKASRNGERIHFADITSIKYSYGEGISSLKSSNRLLDDQIKTYKNEVINYIDLLRPLIKQYAWFNYKRLLLKNSGSIGFLDKAKLCLLHPVGAVIHIFVIAECRSISRRVARKRKQLC